MGLRFQCKSLLGVHDGRSKTRLIACLSLFISPLSLARTATPSTDTKYIIPALAAILVAILAHIIVPEINKFRDKRRARKSYFAYINSSLISSLKDFDDEMSVSMAKTLMDAQPYWLDTLENANLGVPSMFVDTFNAFKKYLSQDHSQIDKYKPYFYYESFYAGDVSHEHPLWELNSQDTEIISDYLLSQAQVENSAKRLYSDDYKKMADSSNPERHTQWVNASNRVLDELALHYINIKKLEAYIGRV